MTAHGAIKKRMAEARREAAAEPREAIAAMFASAAVVVMIDGKMIVTPRMIYRWLCPHPGCGADSATADPQLMHQIWSGRSVDGGCKACGLPVRVSKQLVTMR